jgi:prepilin-type N-terminal cleavage/methylation domain-containing protein
MKRNNAAILALKCGAAPMNSRRRAEQFDGCQTMQVRSLLRPPRAAFSLIEMVVVLMILSVMAAAAIPTFYRSLCYHRLESAARRVKQDLEYLRDAAKATSSALECEFNGRAYTLDDEAVTGLDHGGAYVVDLAAPPYEVASVAIDVDDGATISFDGYGEATEDGHVVLSLADESRTIHFTDGTGQITISNP